MGKVDLVSKFHDLVTEVLNNRGSANSRLCRLWSLEVGGLDVVAESRIFLVWSCQNGGHFGPFLGNSGAIL